MFDIYTHFNKRKRKRSDSVLWQKPLHPQKNQIGNVTTHKRHQKRRLHNDCGLTYDGQTTHKRTPPKLRLHNDCGLTYDGQTTHKRTPPKTSITQRLRADLWRSDNTQTHATKNFDYTTITGWLMTVSWGNDMCVAPNLKSTPNCKLISLYHAHDVWQTNLTEKSQSYTICIRG